jgi:hypothetical protein
MVLDHQAKKYLVCLSLPSTRQIPSTFYPTFLLHMSENRTVKALFLPLKATKQLGIVVNLLHSKQARSSKLFPRHRRRHPSLPHRRLQLQQERRIHHRTARERKRRYR